MGAAEPTTTMTTRLPRSMKDELESLAKSTGRNRNTLVQEAIRRFIDAERWQIDLIEERIREADAGNFATDEEMEALYAEIAPSLRPTRAR
jgi:RHH-type transcriptional regulator, rel operon repressor / antitoxin RelB